MSGPVVPPGQSPPFEVIDDTHRGGVIIIIAACTLVLSLVAVIIRAYVRLILSPPFGLDDLLLLGGTVVAAVQSSLLFLNVSRGLGTSIDLLDPGVIQGIQHNLAACDVLYLLAVYLSKACTAGIYLRLTPRKIHRDVLWVIVALTTAWIITSVFVLTIDCEFNGPWAVPADSCRGLFSRWQFITALDIATEVILFSFSLSLVSGLKMALGRKSIVVMAFAARLPVIAFAAIRLHRFHSFISSPDPTFAVTSHYVWTQMEMNYALTACVAFCLRPYMNAVRTNYGTAGDAVLGSTLGYIKESSGSGHILPATFDVQMQTLKKKDIDNAESIHGPPVAQDERVRSDLFQPRGGGSTVTTAAGESSSSRQRADDGGSVHSSDGGSTRMIIRKKVEYGVQYSAAQLPGPSGYQRSY